MALVKLYFHDGQTVLTIPVRNATSAQVMARLHARGVVATEEAPAIVRVVVPE
jgi:kynureninase